MKTVQLEVPEDLANKLVEYANLYGRKEGQSVIASVLVDAQAYRNISGLIQHTLRTNEDWRERRINRLANVQAELEMTHEQKMQREREILKQNGYSALGEMFE